MPKTSAGSTEVSLDDVVEAMELTLEALDGLRARIDELSEPDDRPAVLLGEVGHLSRRVEEIAEAGWRRAEDDRLQRALDAIDELRSRVDDADPRDAVAGTLDAVAEVAARLDADDTRALTELTLESVEALRAEATGATNETRALLDRTVAGLGDLRARVDAADPSDAVELTLEAIDELRREVESRDPAEALELTLEAIDDVRDRVDGRTEALEGRLLAIEAELRGLARMATALAGAVDELAAPPPAAVGPAPLDDRALAVIADRVVAALMSRFDHSIGASTDRILGRLDASTDRMVGRLEMLAAPAGPAGDPGTAVLASAASAMSRLEGRLDSEFGSVERGLTRLHEHLAELEGLVRDGASQPNEPDRSELGPPAGPEEVGEVAGRLRATAGEMLRTLRNPWRR
jgi:hypothetical protein